MRLPDVMERRTRPFAATDFTLRAADGDTPAGFVGHAAVFNTRTAIGNPLTWGFYEEVAPGAFTKTLQEGDARFLVDHVTNMIVSRVSAGDLRLAEDKMGLATDSDLDTEVSYIADLARNVDKRRITGMSFGFRVVKDDWTDEEVSTSDGQTATVEVRTIREVELFEVSACTFPAYEETDAALRSALIQRGDVEAIKARAEHRPDLIDLIENINREPARSTRGTEPTDVTRERMDRSMRALAARYRLGA